MKTAYKYIRFEKAAEPFAGHTTYEIVNKRAGDLIGQVFWYAPWRSYTARFTEDSVWSSDCLSDIATFLNDLKFLPKGEAE